MKSIKTINLLSILIVFFLYACSPSQVPEPAIPLWNDALPMFRGSPDHVGIYNAPAAQTLEGVKWKFKAESYVTSSPALADGLIYFGSEDGNLYAVRQENGEEVWRFHTEKPINSSPAVSNGLVYFQSKDGFTYALSANNGEIKWKADTGPDRFIDYDYMSSSPTIQDETVYIGGGNGKLYALNANTGAEMWLVEALGTNPIRSSPAVVGDTVYFTAESKLLALDAKTGTEKWFYQSDALIRSSPSVGEGIVVFGDNSSTIYAVDSETGVEKWKYRIRYYWVVSTAAIANGMVYISGDDSYLNVLDVKTGEVKWRFKTAGETIWSSPALVGDVIYIGDWNFKGTKDENGNSLWGYLYAIDSQTGEQLWNFKTGGNIVSSPMVDAEGIIYFGSLDGYIYALQGAAR